jgi:hypothetical protein
VEDGSNDAPFGDSNCGRGTGMWAGYGSIPSRGEGIFLSLEESFNQQDSETTGSLVDVCGFEIEHSRIGELAKKKIISEALVMIPFIDDPNSNGAETVTISDKNFFRITKELYDITKHNIELGDAKPAILADYATSLGLPKKDIQETSISRMIEIMKKYNIPPEFDFITYPHQLDDGIYPFVMYIHEFHHTLDREDLSNIWQGVMPKIARRSEKDSSLITHDLSIVDFFEGKPLPPETRWMVFKVKRKAETNYWKKAAAAGADERFRFDFNTGSKRAPKYSYNWPYDFFSLVELVQIEGGTHIFSGELFNEVDNNSINENLAAAQKAVQDSAKLVSGDD